MIKKFDPKADRDAPMLHVVSFHGVPMYRVTAFVYHTIERHGALLSIASAIRTDKVIEEHNRIFHTNLHGQQWCIDMHKKDPANYAAANSVTTTSHCGFSDGNRAYGGIPAGGKLPEFMWGVDVDDAGKYENNSKVRAVGKKIGFDLVAPYDTSAMEHHHLIIATNPIPLLEQRSIISKTRHS